MNIVDTGEENLPNDSRNFNEIFKRDVPSKHF